MAKRQDPGSNPAHENERPTSHDEDAIPEMTDNDVRSRADEEGDEFDDAEDEDMEEIDTDDESQF